MLVGFWFILYILKVVNSRALAKIPRVINHCHSIQRCSSTAKFQLMNTVNKEIMSCEVFTGIRFQFLPSGQCRISSPIYWLA